MKICFLAPSNSIHTIKWVNTLSERGYDISLLTMHEYDIHEFNKNIRIFKLKYSVPLGYYLNMFQAKKLIDEIKPDIVHAHYASGYGTLGRLINYEPTMLSVWGSDIYIYPYKNKFNMWNIKRNLDAADVIGSTSEDMKQQIIKVNGEDNDISVTPFGIDVTQFSPIQKQTSNTITIGTVKSMEPVYGIDYLLQAFKIILTKVPQHIQLEFLLVGGGKVEFYRNLSKKLGIDHLTRFTDQITHDEVPKYLNKLDIYCAPSLSESFGVAALEASACGLPVVVSNVGGFPEIVKENQTGYLVPPQNTEVLANKILDLVLDENKRKSFGRNGRIFVLENYDWENNVDTMEKVYGNLLNGIKKEK